MKVQWGLRAASEHPERIYRRVRLHGRWRRVSLGLPPKPEKPSKYDRPAPSVTISALRWAKAALKSLGAERGLPTA